MKYIRFLVIIMVLSASLYSYEFIQSYFPDSDAVALSAVENGRGGYVVLIGVKWGSWWDNIGYGLMEVDSMGNYERYVRIFHGGSKGVGVGKYSFKTVDSIRVKGYKDGSACDLASGKIVRLRNGGYFAAVDSVYCYWDWFSHEVICEDHLVGFRINDDLGVEWRRNYPASGYVDELRESEDKSGDIIILSGEQNLLRIDSTGEIEINRGYYTEGYGGDIVETGKGGYVVCGGKYVRGVDSLGSIKWERSYDTIIIPGGNHLGDWCRIDRITRDINGNGYKLSGTKVHYNDSTGENVYTGFLISIDDTGGFEWIRYYDGWFREVSMNTVEDGYVVIIQDKDSCPNDTLAYPLWVIGIVKLDSVGEIEWWRKFYRCPHEDRYPGWAPLDGRGVSDGYLMSGYHNFASNKPVLIKTDTLGLVDGVGENIFIPSITGRDYIIKNRSELRKLFKGNPGIKIYDLSGREIKLKTSIFTIRRGIYLYKDKKNRKRGLLLLLVK